VSPLRRFALALAVACCAFPAAVASAQAASLGNVDVNYDGSNWTVIPSSLSGAVGDTFVLRNLRNNTNNNGVSYIALVNGTGQAVVSGAACTTDAACTVNDTFAAPGNPLTATVAVVGPGTFSIRRTTNSGNTYTTVGTLTVTAGNTPPSPDAPATNALAITSVSPSSGLTTGGEKVTIVGSGFSADAKPTVTFGGTAATDVTVANETTVTAVTPARAKGAVDVAVTSGGASATLANGYTYNQGYWLTMKTSRPAKMPGLSSIGAVRTGDYGDWAQKRLTGPTGVETTTFSSYRGGINCGERKSRERTELLGGNPVETTWDGGPCRYAFPAGTRVVLTPLASSSVTWLVPGLMLNESVAFPAAWRDGCTGGGTTCTVSVDRDITASLAWGHARFGFLRVFANVAFPTFGADGSLQYFDAFLAMGTPPAVVGGTPGYFLIASMPVAAASDARSPHAAASTVVCRTSARLVGRQLRARCQVNPALARQLRKGKVRLTAKWQVRLPNTKSARELRTGRIIVSNRRVAVTG
jgi:hypothetical protein